MIGVQDSSPPAVARSGVRRDVRGVAAGDTPHKNACEAPQALRSQESRKEKGGDS